MSIAVIKKRAKTQSKEFLIPEIIVEDIELKKIANSLTQNVPSLEELDKIGEKIRRLLTHMIIEEREKERC